MYILNALYIFKKHNYDWTKGIPDLFVHLSTLNWTSSRNKRKGWVQASRTNPAEMASFQTLHCLSGNPREAAGGVESDDFSLPLTRPRYLTNMITHHLLQPLPWITLDMKWSKCTPHLKRIVTHIQVSSASPCCAPPLQSETGFTWAKNADPSQKYRAEEKVTHNRPVKCMPSWHCL